ncbi:amino acid adenylation domain-containing protein [Streptomyces echinatus]|uniref:amino acid adenylation domain-containing protein n=1 Tax=Streptomyces echinatus TaxID=67293 RepID=UPI00381F4C7E
MTDVPATVHSGTVVDMLRANAVRDPDAVAFSHLTFPAGGPEHGRRVSLSRAELDTRCCALADALAAHELARHRVLILAPSGLDFIVGLFGTLYAGAVAVTCPPPLSDESDPRTERAVQIASDAQVSAVVTTREVRDRLGELRRRFGDVPWIAVDDMEPAGSGHFAVPATDRSDLALLQYTSGATGGPKGVMISHDNLVHQLPQAATIFQLPPGSNVVSWISPYHALGIVVHLMLSQYLGGQAVFLAPEDFVGHPLRWLRAISDTPGPVLSCAPNFAFGLCTDHISEQERTGLDLSGWRTTLNTAERVQAHSMARFIEAYQPYGFRTAAMCPGFGMTEAMVLTGQRRGRPLVLDVDAAELERGRAVVLGEPDAAPDGAAAGGERTLRLVGVGQPGPYSEVIVVDPERGRRLGEHEVGEVWIRGPVVCQGYWNRAELTEETFGARLSDGEGPYLRSGDMGFLHDGELVLCGRRKEMIIVRGRNLYPHDIESSGERAHPALRGAPTAAFSVNRDTGEELVLVQSVPDADALPISLSELARRIRAAVTAAHEVDVHHLVLVEPAQIPKTISGKIQRGECRRRYLAGELETLLEPLRAGPPSGSAPVRPVNARSTGGSVTLPGLLAALDPSLRAGVISAELRRRLGELLDVPTDDVPTAVPLVALGLESIRAMELRALLERDVQVDLPLATFLRSSVAELTELMVHRLDGRHASAAAETPEPFHADPEHRFEPFRLTGLQQAYLVGRRAGDRRGDVATHLYLEIEAGELDLRRLETALTALVSRHDMLRAVVAEDGTQRVLPESDAAPVPFSVTDCSAASGPRTAAAVREELSHEIRPIGRWPMWEVRALILPGDRIRLHISIDLLIADVASIRLFFDDWRRLYAGERLPPLRTTFRDCVNAHAVDPGDPEYAAARDYWLRRVPDLPEGPQLPWRRGATAPARWSRRAHRLPATSWSRIRQLALQHELTPTSVLLAAFATVLGRWSTTDRFLLNLPLFSRRRVHPDVDALIGDFTSVVLLEVDLRGRPGIAELAERLHRQLWRDLEHGAFDGVAVQRELAKARTATGVPHCPVVFASARDQGWDQHGQDTGALGQNWLGRTTWSISQTPQVLLDHQVYENAGALEFNWDSPADALLPGVRDEMFDAYCRLLDSLVDAGAWTGGVDVCPAGLNEFVARLDATDGAVPSASLADGVMGWAAREPDRVAVVTADGGVLRYGDLGWWASGVAETLLGSDTDPGALIAVGMSKSAEQVVAALGVHLAGRAYLPVDVELPPRRRAELLAAAGCSVVLVRAGDDHRQWPDTVRVVAVEDCRNRARRLAESPAKATDVAYVLFTSGSTGAPKGVTVSHQAALGTCTDVCDRFGIGADDAVLGLSSLSFDLSVFDVFGVLGAGGRLVLPRPGSQRDPEHWLELVAEHGVTVWNSVPAVAEMVVSHLGAGAGTGAGDRQGAALAGVRVALWSGDWIPVGLPDRWREWSPRCRLISLGGATEAAIWSICYEIGEVDPEWDSIPYGRPLTNQRVHVLDDRLEYCPIWVVGELYIGGLGLAEGYWGDPVRTAERFITHPVSGERLYRTGDLGRWRPDGTIEFLGRTDGQVKLGGFRIELGEIDATLAQHPAIARAVTTATGTRHHPYLTTFVVPDRAQRPAPALEAVGDGAEYESLLGAVITDPAHRASVTMAQRGRRADLTWPATALPDLLGPERTERRWNGRRSHRRFAATEVPLAELARLLGCLRAVGAGHRAVPKYRYGSAGSLYPVRTYVYVHPGRVAGLPGGCYYYDPLAHRLCTVRGGVELPASIHLSMNQDAFSSAAFLLLLVGPMAEVEPMYGRRAHDFCLIEAGAMSQLLAESATEGPLGLCQIGLLRDENPLRTLFALGEDEVLLHSLLGGVGLEEPGEAMAAGVPSPREAGPVGLEGLVGRVRELAMNALPAHMVPSRIRVIDELPLTGQGKVDRRRLEELAGRPETGVEAVEPASETEARVAAIVAETLGRDRVSVTENLFALGADSVQLIAVRQRLCEEFGHELPLARMFENASIRTVSTALATAPRPAPAED